MTEAGYTHPVGNKKKLKGGYLRNHEKDNVLDFGIGERGGDELVTGSLKASVAFIPFSYLN